MLILVASERTPRVSVDLLARGSMTGGEPRMAAAHGRQLSRQHCQGRVTRPIWSNDTHAPGWVFGMLLKAQAVSHGSVKMKVSLPHLVPGCVCERKMSTYKFPEPKDRCSLRVHFQPKHRSRRHGEVWHLLGHSPHTCQGGLGQLSTVQEQCVQAKRIGICPR